MDSSESRNSTTAQPGFAAALDWTLAAAIAAAAIIITVGIDVRIGALAIRAHDAVRVLVVVALFAAARIWVGVRAWPAWLTRMMMRTAIAGSIASWFRFLVTTIGGADSWGYVSASELIRHGRLVEAAPIAGWLSAANRLQIASPLGWAPAPDGSGIVPTYPLGLPAVMAMFSAIGGTEAVFFVAPAAAAITLVLVYRLARHWYGEDTALFAAALVAWNPVFIAYAKQPMSDITATMWVMVALVMAMRASAASAAWAGCAAGAAVLTRPVLLIAAALIPWFSGQAEGSRRRGVIAGVALSVCVGAQMLLQRTLFGSAFSTGYGSAGNLFAVSHLPDNLRIYGGHLWHVLGPVWLAGLFLGLMAARPNPRSRPAMLFGAVLMPYLLYLPFDHWETLRFLLPGLVPLTVVAADGLGKIARIHKMSTATVLLCGVLLVAIVVPSERLLRHASTWDIASIEARYPLAGEWVHVNTPQNSVVLANQHSGSLRWYGKRQTLRWDFIAPEQLVTTVRELQAHGAPVYVALEGDEVAMFDARFADAIGRLQVDHVGQIRNVSFRRLLAAE